MAMAESVDMVKNANQEHPEQKARAVALRLLARREHSRHELELKLRQRKFDAGLIEEVLDEYEENDWLSDERFAEVYTRQKLDQGYGPMKILAELQQRGIHTTPACLREMTDSEWIKSATRLRDRRFGLSDIREDWDEKGRQGRFLARRGFGSDHIEAALEARLDD